MGISEIGKFFLTAMPLMKKIIRLADEVEKKYYKTNE